MSEVEKLEKMVAYLTEKVNALGKRSDKIRKDERKRIAEALRKEANEKPVIDCNMSKTAKIMFRIADRIEKEEKPK